MRAGGGIVIGGEPVEAIVERFPRLSSTLDTGIRSMLTVALEHEDNPSAALVLASTQPSAYSAQDLELVRRVGEAIVGRIMDLG
jgi:GAF domain-containing protein